MIRVVPSRVVTEVLSVLGIMRGDTINAGRDAGLLRRSCCRRAYLRGAFLGGGSVSRPEGEYHLELVTGNQDFAKTLVRLLKSFGLAAKVADRKQDYVVYLKDGDAITSFLRVIGAHNALFAFENVRVVKDMRNQVNRLVNCETANLQKTVNAAVRQVEKNPSDRPRDRAGKIAEKPAGSRGTEIGQPRGHPAGTGRSGRRAAR